MNLAGEGIIRTGGRGNVSAAVNNASYPLHDAAREGRPRVVRLLLEQGHSATALDAEGFRASDRAREAGHHALADELKDRETESLPASNGHAEVERLSIKELIGLVQGKAETVAQLISIGRVHAIDGKGDTALHICAAQGRLQFCDQLIKAGADPAAMNFERKKPHDRAAENGQAMAAGLLRSLLPDAVSETNVPPERKPEPVNVKPTVPWPVVEETDETFDFDDLDFDFESAEEAEDFHRDIERDEYTASFDAVEERVTRLSEEDGAEFDFDDVGGFGFRIDADDILDPLPQTAENADAATFRSFLDVHRRRRSTVEATAPKTRYHAISDIALLEWVEKAVVAEACTEEDVDLLIGEIRGSFAPEIVRANLVHELTNLGLLMLEEDADEAFVAGALPDPEDIADMLSCICNGSNMRPGMESKPLSARAEARLFRELAACQQEICRALVSDAMLVSVVVMLGERVETGSVDPSLLSDLDIQHARQTPDRDVFSAALSYLVGYQTLLEEGDDTSEDREDAFEAVSALKLSRTAVELIAKGVQANSELNGLRLVVEASLAAQERYRQEILLAHMALVRRQASIREAYTDDIEDLFQEGVFGLLQSIEKFDPERGYRFMTYSQFSVRQAIGRAQDNTGHLVRLPTHVAVMVRLAKASVEYLPLNADWGLLEETVQKQAQLSLRKFEFLRNLQELPVEFDEFAFACLDAVLGVEDVLLKSRLCREVRWGLSKLKPRQERILRLRFGFGDLDEHTLEECGQTFGVTRERIRQIEAKALRLLKHPARCGKLGFLL